MELSEFLKSSNVRSICDLGCGPGRNLLFLARQGFEIYGTDISEVALKRAHKRASEMKLKVELKRGT